MRKIFSLLGLVSAAIMPFAASATIIGGGVTGGTSLTLDGATFVKLTVPFTDSVPNNTIGDNNLDQPHLYGFDEEQNIVITSTIVVNIGTNPVAGDTVASHYIAFDPGPSRSQIGYIDFDADIYGVATSRTNLDNSDFLANTGVTYLSDALRGLEGGDVVQIDSTNARRLLVNWTASNPGDYVRVFTKFSEIAALPAPGGLAVLSAALLGFGVMRRRSAFT